MYGGIITYEPKIKFKISKIFMSVLKDDIEN
jgi:hypothetical protein